MIWNLLYASLLSGAMTISPEAEPKSDNPYPSVSFTEIGSIPDPVGMEIIQKMLPGVHRHSVGSADTDIFDTTLDVQCLNEQRAIVLESGGKKSPIYFSKIRQIVPTRYTPQDGASATSLLLFNYQNNFKDRYQFIVEEKQEGDLDLIADIFTEFIGRESKKVPCEGEYSQPEPAVLLSEPVVSPPMFKVRLSEIEDLCSGKINELSGRRIDYIGTFKFSECNHKPTAEGFNKMQSAIKEKYIPSAKTIFVICGNATTPTAQRCDTSVPDFGNEALAYRRAKYTALKLEEMLGDQLDFTIIPYGNGTVLDRRTLDIYLIQEKQ